MDFKLNVFYLCAFSVWNTYFSYFLIFCELTKTLLSIRYLVFAKTLYKSGRVDCAWNIKKIRYRSTNLDYDSPKRCPKRQK